MNIGNIITGWARVMGIMEVTEQVQQLSKSRLIICSSCEHAKPNSCLEFINGKAEQVEGMYCTSCLCPCLQKSLTDDLCPLGKWNNLNNIKTQQ